MSRYCSGRGAKLDKKGGQQFCSCWCDVNEDKLHFTCDPSQHSNKNTYRQHSAVQQGTKSKIVMVNDTLTVLPRSSPAGPLSNSLVPPFGVFFGTRYKARIRLDAGFPNCSPSSRQLLAGKPCSPCTFPVLPLPHRGWYLCSLFCSIDLIIFYP